jgi:hypothetical protein
MDERKHYTLCGGTFLVLLLETRKLRKRARQHLHNESDGLKDSELFEELIRVAMPSFYAPAGRSMSTYTSSYKACRLSANDSLPLDNDELISNFDREVKTNYRAALRRMCGFTERFLQAEELGGWLVRAIMETINYDDSITDELFYVDGPDQPFDKKNLVKASDVSLQPFLLGIWHFILTNRPDNKIGADTFAQWHSPKGKQSGGRKFSSDVGRNWNRGLHINLVSVDELSDEAADRSEDGRFDVPDDMDVLCTPGGIAPELKGEPPWILVPKDVLSEKQGEFTEYLSNVADKYSRMKTLLYNDAPRDFYDFFVCSNVSQKIQIRQNTFKTKIIADATANNLRSVSNFILLTGTGGLGKSMMMRHLLLDSVKHYDQSGELPVFVPLKNYDDSCSDLFTLVYTTFENLGGTDDEEIFSELLKSGNFLFFFDGMDEIRSDFKKKFEQDLDGFTDRYKKNMFVISSRPVGTFISLSRFTVLELCPFTKGQALELVDKLDFRPDVPEIKSKFREELDQRLFVTHRSFTENPLLLTIMLMTFEQFAEIPSKMHVFYREAYVALSQKHDASKGAYKRVLKTGLTADQFSDYLAEFCARTYRDEKFEFTEDDFDRYFSAMHACRKGSESPSASAFREDLVENMCLMFYEGGKYFFTHRSFQEYFCALYFSKQKDKTLKAIGDFFENKPSRNYTDETFGMLYDMIPEKIEEYVFEPFLTSLFKECGENDGYWTFLKKMYPVIYYESGETDSYAENEAQSFLYNSAVQIHFGKTYIDPDMLPHDERYAVNEWVYLDDEYKSNDYDRGTLIDIEEVPWAYKEEFGEPDVVGRSYELDIDEILENAESNQEIITVLDSDDFPLKAEFLNVRKYTAELADKHQPKGDDLFDLFE